LFLVGVDVLRSHKLTYERGLAHSPRAQQGHGVRRDVVQTVLRRLLALLLLLIRLSVILLVVVVVVVVVIVRDRRGVLFAGIVFLCQAVAPRPTFPERIASVHDTCRTRRHRRPNREE